MGLIVDGNTCPLLLRLTIPIEEGPRLLLDRPVEDMIRTGLYLPGAWFVSIRLTGVLFSRRRSMSPPPRSAGSSYYEGGPPGPYSHGSYRGQPDYPAPGPPGPYYDAPNSGAMYRGNPGRDEADRRFADTRMTGYDRR